MSLTLAWGKEFRLENTVRSTGGVYEELFGVDGDTTGINGGSLENMMAVAAKHGVSVDLWPVYLDCQLDKDVPLDDVKTKSDQLRLEFDKIPDDVVAQDYWLNFVASLILRKGHIFFIMGI